MGQPQPAVIPARSQQIANTFLEHIANGDVLDVLQFATVLGWAGEKDTTFNSDAMQAEYIGAIKFAADMLTLPFG